MEAHSFPRAYFIATTLHQHGMLLPGVDPSELPTVEDEETLNAGDLDAFKEATEAYIKVCHSTKVITALPRGNCSGS